MRRLVLSLVFLLLPVSAVRADPVGPPAPEPLLSAADAVALAAADLSRVPEREQPHTRYLFIGHLPRHQRPEMVRVLSGHLNCLSRNLLPVPPVVVTYTPAVQVLIPLTYTPVTPVVTLANVGPAQECLLWDTVLLRINMRLYRDARGRGFPARVWEQFKFFDPDLHVQVKTPWPGGVWPGDGRHYAAGSFKVQKAAPGFWLTDTPARKALWLAATKATHSEVPVVYGDWFLDRTAMQQGRTGHGYYDFLEIQTEADFQDLVGASPDRVDLDGETGAIIVQSAEVALNNRHLRRQRHGYWYTLDFDASTGKQNAVRIPDGLRKTAKATEQIGPLPNGHPAWLLAALDKGKATRQDVAPGNIAGNTRGIHPDLQVHVGLCWACHKKVVIAPDDYARKLAEAGDAFRSPDEKKDYRLMQLYLTNISAQVEGDQLGYDRAMRSSCGLDTVGFAAAYIRTFNSYHFEAVTLEVAARRWGLTPAQVQKTLLRQKAAALAEAAKLGYATDPVDPVLAAFAREKPLTMRREQFEEVTAIWWLVWRKWGQ